MKPKTQPTVNTSDLTFTLHILRTHGNSLTYYYPSCDLSTLLLSVFNKKKLSMAQIAKLSKAYNVTIIQALDKF